MNYCTEQKFLITNDDLMCIVDRGLNDSYEYRRSENIRYLRMDFGNIPMDPDIECIDEERRGFTAGTHREEIWT